MADTSKITLKQLKDAMNKAKNYTDNEIAGITGVSKVEPEELDMPKVFFYGTALPTTKDNVNLTMDYISNTAKFSSFVKLKCQGTSSMSYAKKNFTVAMFSDESRTIKLKKDFKGWGAQSKFCLKANYVDTTHTRNISGARIAYDMVKSRPDSPFRQQLLQCPRNGAVDGFPIKLYFNGEFYGIYTWNIPKDGWMFNMDAGNANHMVLCAEKNNDSTNISDDILRCEFRMEWDGTDGNSWSIEFGTYSDTLKNSFNRCVNFVMTATDEEFKANIGNYFDLYSLLDYYCFSYFTAHIDGLAKNMLMATYDGVIWGATLYDMDSIYGADWQGSQFKATNIQCPEQYQDTNSLLWQRIESCFPVELYARYLELRQGALSLSNIIKHVEEIYDVIPDRVFVDEKAKWTSLPGVNTNTMTRFRNYMKDRAVYVDAQMLEIGTRVPCTGIVLSADTLSFTTTDTQTLSVVVSPENCTDTITWSVSPTRIVTVKNGVVTPIRNGEATITATCGSYSDTCAVTVSGISESGGGTDTRLLYSLPEETVFNGTSDYIDTGVALFSTDQDFTIALDVTAANQQKDRQSTLFHCMHEEDPWPGISMMSSDINGGLYIPKGSNVAAIGSNTLLINLGARTRVIITKEGNTLSAYSSNGSTGTSTYTYTQLSENLLIGAYQETNGAKGRYFVGTVHDFKIYNKVFTSQEKDDYLNFEQNNISRVFKIDSTCMNTADNTLTDNIAGINATLTGNPTVSDNQIAFTANDKFSFDLSSLSLNTSNRTLRVKFTPTSLNTDNKNVLIFGETANAWNSVTSVYISDTKIIMQHGTNTFANMTVGDSNAGNNNNRLSSAPTINTEYEIVISENVTTNEVRWFINGTLVQNGISTLFNPSYLSNIEGSSRFIGNYSLIEIYNGYCNDYAGFTNMVNNASSGGGTDIYATAEYAITEPRTFNGTSDYIDTGIQLFDTAKDFAVYIDYTPTAGITQANNTTVFHCLHEVSPYRGLCMMLTGTDNVYFIGGQSGSASYAGQISPFDNHKFIIQFANGVISSIKTVNDGFVQDVTLGATAANNPYVQVTENLLLGCYQDISGNKGRYWNGTINKFGVWYKQLTNDEIKILTGCDSNATDADITIQTTYTNGYIARSSEHLVVNENVSLGEIIISTGDITSDFISCENTDTFTINVPQTQYGCGVVAYDSSQSYLNTYDKTKSWSYSPTGDVDIKETTIDVNNLPENTAYIRICVNTTDSSSVTIIKHSIVYS